LFTNGIYWNEVGTVLPKAFRDEGSAKGPCAITSHCPEYLPNPSSLKEVGSVVSSLSAGYTLRPFAVVQEDRAGTISKTAPLANELVDFIPVFRVTRSTVNLFPLPSIA